MNILWFEKDKYVRIDMKQQIKLNQQNRRQTEEFREAIRNMKRESPGLFYKPTNSNIPPSRSNPFKGNCKP